MMAKFQSIEHLNKTFLCWVSVSCTFNNEILPPNITEANLEDFFETKAREIGQFSTAKLTYNEKHKAFQCFINFLTEDAAKTAAKLFNQYKLSNFDMKSEYRPAKNTNDQPDQKQNNPLLIAAENRATSFTCWTSIDCTLANTVLPSNMTKNHYSN